MDREVQQFGCKFRRTPTSPQAPLCNRLLQSLARADIKLLARHMERVSLQRGSILAGKEATGDYTSDGSMPHAYFPKGGVNSVFARSVAGREVEVAMIGREGFVHPALLAGRDHVPYRIEVQAPCIAYRVPRDAFLAAAQVSHALRRLLPLFAEAQAVQTAFACLSCAVHGKGERLARWLLMHHDRCGSDTILVTHKELAVRLAVRRPTVTTALHVLEGMGAI